MRILHFQGKGEGFMLGIEEYVVITDEDETPVEEWKSPGFELDSETEVDELPYSLPLNTMLVPQK